MLVSLGLEEHEEVFTRLSSLFFSMKIIQPGKARGRIITPCEGLRLGVFDYLFL